MITDVTAPVADIATLADVTAECEVTALTDPAATDACGGLVTVTNDATLPITAQGTTVVTWTYTDVNGNSSTQTQDVVLTDVTAPVADTATLADVIAECELTSLTAPTATDACGGIVTVTNDATLPINTLGDTVVTWTYTDANGNSSTQVQTVTIQDTGVPAPVVTNLPDLTAECIVTATAPTATDGCAGLVINGTTSDPTTYSAVGTYVITWTYTGGNGNTSSQTQTVIVTDVTAPVADAANLADITAQCEVTTLTAPSATDNCGGLVTVTNDATLPITASALVTWTYTDVNGNSSTQTQDVVINDTTAPVADVATLADVTAECEVTTLTDPTATDNCGGLVTVTNDATLPITNQGTTVVTWTYTDVNGNSSTQTQDVIINDTTAPVADIATLADVTAQCDVTTLTDPTATDNCGGLVTVTNDAILPITAQGTTVVTWTYTDVNGNSSTQTQNVVIDNIDEPISSGDEEICQGDVIPALSVTVNAGETVDWYDAAIGGNLLLADNSVFTPVSAGIYYAEARSISDACVSPARTAVELIENPIVTIDNVIANDPTLIACPLLDNGSIVITATGSNLEYSIDNGSNFQVSNTFSDLNAGTYNIVVRDNLTGCSNVYATPVELTAPNCVAELVVSITQDSGPTSVNNIGQTLGYTIVLENSGTLDITV